MQLSTYNNKTICLCYLNLMYPSHILFTSLCINSLQVIHIPLDWTYSIYSIVFLMSLLYLFFYWYSLYFLSLPVLKQLSFFSQSFPHKTTWGCLILLAPSFSCATSSFHFLCISHLRAFHMRFLIMPLLCLIHWLRSRGLFTPHHSPFIILSYFFTALTC